MGWTRAQIIGLIYHLSQPLLFLGGLGTASESLKASWSQILRVNRKRGGAGAHKTRACDACIDAIDASAIVQPLELPGWRIDEPSAAR